MTRRASFAGVCLVAVMLLATSVARAVQFTGGQTGPGEWTYTLTYDPMDNYSICQLNTTITLSGLAGVTQALPPTSTDFPTNGIGDLNLLWTPQILNGGTTVTWTHGGPGTGNFSTPIHVFGFKVTAPAVATGSASVATSGFATDGGCPTTVRDIQTTTIGPAAASATTNTANLVAGWNLAGNSVNAALDMAATFGDAAKVIAVWKWVASKSAWAFYSPTLTDGGATYAASKGYDFLTSVSGGEGFWVNAKVAFTAQLPSGSAISSSAFQSVPSGWSLIAVGDSPTASGFNKTLSITPPTAGDIPINLTSLWAWGATLGRWYFYAPNLEKTGSLAAYLQSTTYLDFGTTKLDPTMGFWVNVP